MNKLALTLFALLCILGCSHATTKVNPKVSSIPLLQAYATKDGVISLTNNYPGFEVSVDFSYDYNDASDSDYNPTNMILGLYTSQTMLSYGCGRGFTNYYCSGYTSCTAYTSSSMTQQFPSFTATGYLAYTSIYIDYSNWELESNSVMIASSCTSTGSSAYGANSYGILGVASTSTSERPSYFSIYLDQNGDSGKLMFTTDYSYAVSSSSSVSISADVNMQFHTFNYLYVNYQYIYNTNTSLIFDINAQYIGLPLALYNKLITNFNGQSSITCPTYYYTGVTCTYYGTLDNLPTIYLYIQNQAITLPPSVYVSGYSDGSSQVSSFTLNLQALDSSLTGTNYVTPAFQNYIVLDYHVMSYYYTTFYVGGTYNTATLYVANHSIFNPGNPTLWIVLGCIGAVLLLLMCLCCCKAAANAKARRPIVSTTSAQAPLINNMASDSYTYDQNIYSQPAYNQFPQQTYPVVQGGQFPAQFPVYQPQTGFDNSASPQYYVQQ